MKNLTLLAILLALSLPAAAGNDNNPPNECGNHGNNCDGGNNGGAGGNGTGIGVGVGVGIGVGGSASATGGQGGAGGKGGDGGHGGLGVGYGGDAAVVGSGNAKQDQAQAQGQKQGQAQTAVAGASSDQRQSNQNAVDASSANDNRSNAAGNTTSTVVSFKDERNAPPVYLGQLTATMSCSGSFNAGSSSPGGAGAFGFTWISGDCRSVVAADKFRELGMIDTSCRILKTTKGFKRAAKADPTLASIDCTMKPAPAAAVVPPPQASAYAPRIPRG